MKFKTIFSVKLSILMSCLVCHHIIAQNAIDTVVIETTQIPLKSVETGRNVTVIKGHNLRASVFSSLDDLLQFMPGIEVQTRNGFGAQGDITMRGSTFTQVLVLVDGMKLNDPLTGHFNGYIPVTPAEIEQIEILRGAASAIYGADAVGGVINIVTKKYANHDQQEISGEFNLGEERLMTTQQGFSIQKNKYFLTGGVSINQSDGQLVPAKQVGDNTLEEYKNYFDVKTVGFSLGYKLSDKWRLQGRTSYDDRDFSARYFYTTSPFDKSVERTKNWFNQVQLSRVADKSSTHFNVAYRHGSDEFIFSPDFPSTNLHTTNYLNFQGNHLVELDENTTINFGIQLDNRSIESTDRGDHADLHAGVFAMGTYQGIDRLFLTASARLDYDENYDLAFSPQLNASYQLSKATLRASIGKSIRAADYTERYVSFNLQNLTPGRSLGNADLNAENSWSEEIGIDVHLSKSWILKSTLFARQSSNLIDYVSTNEANIPNNQNLQAGADYFYATNVTDVQTLGFEFESWYSHWIRPRYKLSWGLGYTYLNTTNDEDVISVYISSHANHLIASNLILENPHFGIGLNVLYKNRDELFSAALNESVDENYMVVNGQVTHIITHQFDVQIKCFNMLNNANQDILGAPLPGRWFALGVKYKL